MKSVVEMAEWSQRLLLDIELNEEDVRLVALLHASKKRIEIDALREGVRIRTGSWVGVIQFSSFTLKIIPKLAGAYTGLVKMLAYTNGLKFPDRHLFSRLIEVEKNADLFDLIALLFSEACEGVIRKGLLHDYVEVEEALPVLRGRLRVSEQVRQRYGQLDKLECRYDDYLSDIRENQLLLAALDVCRRRVTNPTIRYHIMRQLNVLRSACSIQAVGLGELKRPFTYHRLNGHYEEAHELARFILDAFGIKDLLKIGSTRSHAFLIDMNVLFENFVEKMVRQIFGEMYAVESQVRLKSIIYDVTHSRSYSSVRPDVVVRDSAGQRLAIDAKYKKYSEKKISSADIYQTFLYAYAFRDDRLAVAWLFYPASNTEAEQLELRIRSQGQLSGATIQAFGLPIPSLLEELLGYRPHDIISELSEVFSQHLGADAALESADAA